MYLYNVRLNIGLMDKMRQGANLLFEFRDCYFSAADPGDQRVEAVLADVTFY